MPVRKFQSVEAMNLPIWRTPGDPALYRAIAGVWEVGRRTRPRRFVPGVFRFKDIAELEAATDRQAPR